MKLIDFKHIPKVRLNNSSNLDELPVFEKALVSFCMPNEGRSSHRDIYLLGRQDDDGIMFWYCESAIEERAVKPRGAGVFSATTSDIATYGLKGRYREAAPKVSSS